MDEDGHHGSFRDLCLVYSDFNRPVFLEAIQDWFIRSANKEELKALREAISIRASNLRKAGGGNRGRPRGRDDAEWLGKAKQEAYWRHVLGLTWPQVAAKAGLLPTKPNLRTLQRRQDQLAAIVWSACRQFDSGIDQERLKRHLERAPFQQWLRGKAGLPFRDLPEVCKKIVLGLVPRGPAAVRGFFRSHPKSTK